MSRKRTFHSGALPVFGLLVLSVVLFLYGVPALETALGRTQDKSLAAANEAAAEVYFFDVGQGDSTLIRVGDYTVLIDAGVAGAGEPVAASLEALNVDALSVVVATHPHADHIGGMVTAIEDIPVGLFMMPFLPESQTPTSRTYEALLDTLIERGIQVQALSADTAWTGPENTAFQVLSPPRSARYEETNDYSAVLRFSYGDVSFLFMGDAEAPVENELIERSVPLKSTVLKCGHHGSVTSTSRAFLKAADPLYAVLSCGRDNAYGHPHEKTLRSLEALEIPTLRTDTLGTVAIFTDGTGLSSGTWSAEAGFVPLG